MHVTKVSLSDFLSYPSVRQSFGAGLNVLTGENASGKTNLIDSIYYAALGKSSRIQRDKDLINWSSENGARVTVNIQKRFSKHEVDVYIDPQGKKRILVDGLPIQRIGELMGVINIVFFSPNEMKLIKESPADRRRFLDISLSQQSKTYFYTLQKYNALLVQRNKLLKSYAGRPALNDMLPVVDTELTRCGAFLIQERMKFVTKLTPVAAAQHKKLTGEREELTLLYETEDIGTGDVREALQALLKKSYENDCRLAYTTTGPHRDDLKIASNGVDLRKFGSQGQQRSAVLSLKLAEIALFKERTGETPILLLDDVLSELDAGRREALFSAIDGIQTVVTCTEFDEKINREYREFIIKDRNIFQKD